MDSSHFDDLIRRLLAPRRSLLGGALALAAGWLGDANVGARKKRKHKKLKRNAFGCVDVGNACRGNSVNCCSGICEGKKPRKGKKDASQCTAHHGEGCPAGADSCALSDVPCGTNGHCFITTGKASFCGSFGACFACAKDEDCEPGFGPGAACTVCAAACPETRDRLCRAAAAPVMAA